METGPALATLWAREVGTHARICLRAKGPGRSRRSLPDSAHSERLSCCKGSAGSGQTGGHSCPRRWGPHCRCTGTAGRAGGPQRAPVGPQKSRHRRSHSAALGRGEDCVWGSTYEERRPAGSMGVRVRCSQASVPSLLVEQNVALGQDDLQHDPARPPAGGWVAQGKPLCLSELGLFSCKVGQ